MTENSELYLGCKNAVVVCVNNNEDAFISGEFFHKFKCEGTVFTNLDELLFKLEDFFDSINYPVSATNMRNFGGINNVYPRKEITTVNKDDQILEKKGSLGTFIVRVQHRQNSTWQGRITWVEENKTLSFRSALEMIKLIESGIFSEEDQIKKIDWDK